MFGKAEKESFTHIDDCHEEIVCKIYRRRYIYSEVQEYSQQNNKI